MLVLGRVTRVARPSHASIDIVAILPDDNNNNNNNDKSDNDDIGQGNGQMIQPLVIPLLEPYTGTLRQGEIKPKSSLEVRIEECFRPGDVILARIHAEGEREYILSTAEAELGVVRAVCEGSGVQMEAMSWKEMRCPISLAREPRKVAKPRLS
jgi:exosome complex component CSL4